MRDDDELATHALSAAIPGEAIAAMLGLERALRDAPGANMANIAAQFAKLGGGADATLRIAEELQRRYPTGAMLIDATGRLVAVTDAMSRQFDIDIGSNIFEHEWDGDVLMIVRRAVRALSKSLEKNAELVQLSSEGHARLAAIEPYSGATGPLILFRLIGQPWHDEIAARLKTTFSLSDTEVELARCLYLGLRSRGIAEKRERSIDTVRTQIKVLLRKTSMNSQSALIAMIAALSLEVRPAEISDGIEMIRRQDGSFIRYRTFGASEGHPVLMFYTSTDPFPGEARAAAFAEAGLRIIAPLFDETDGTRDQSDLFILVANRARDLLRALKVKTCVVAGHREGSLYAVHFAAANPSIAQGVVAVDMTIPNGAYDMSTLPPGVTALLASIRSYPFASEMAFRLLRRLIDSGDAGMNYLIDLMDREDPINQRDSAVPEIRDIVKSNYRFCYRDCGLLVRHAALWYSDWSEIADKVLAHMPVRFLQGDSNCVLPVAPLHAYCLDKENASPQIVNDAGQCLLYTHTSLAVEHLLSMAAKR